MKVIKVPFPKTHLLNNALSRIDYADAFTCTFPASEHITVDDVVKSFFNAAPGWVEILFVIRNKIVRLFGLKAPDPEDRKKDLADFKIEKGNQISLFKIYDRTDNEVLMGEDDKHLNFRISILLEKQDAVDQKLNLAGEEILKDKSAVEAKLIRHTLTLTTLVTFHNFLGRLYFLPVKPMHKMVVSSMMRGIIKNLKKGNVMMV
jgi:hypothetical protein